MNTIKNTNHEEMIPLKFHLSQNYPNPFKEKTKIKYCVAFKTEVNISVFNSKGHLIKNLITEKQDAGTYEIEFNASSLPSGVYFYQLKSGEFIQTKKMLLMK